MSVDITGLYICAILSTAFYGTGCAQTYFYCVHYENDPFRIKIFVAVMWALITIHEGLIISGVYKDILAGLLNQPFPVHTSFELILLNVITALVAVFTQGYFVYRIYVFSGKNIVAPLIWVPAALVELVFITVNTGKELYGENGVVIIYILNRPLYSNMATVSLSFAAGADVLIAACMTFLLIRERATTRFHSTVHILERLTVFAVNSGIWTATFAVLAVILIHVTSRPVFDVFALPLCQVYFNALLGNLSARTCFRKTTTTYNVDMDLIVTNLSPSSQGSDRNNENK